MIPDRAAGQGGEFKKTHSSLGTTSRRRSGLEAHKFKLTVELIINARHLIFVALLASTSLFACFCSTVNAQDKPNVLFISVDDMNCDLGVYGHPLVKTPNLDRLCKMGVRFDSAYCQQPFCGPSRASIMTGLRPDTLDMHTLKHELRQKNPDVVTLGQMFRNNDYFVARAGKIYHYGNPFFIGTDGNDDPESWDERYNPIGIDRSQQQNITKYGVDKQNDTRLGQSLSWWDPESRDDEHTDGMVASKIVELIKQKKDQPFFLAAGFFNPHCPYVAPKKYFDLYPIDQIKMPDLEEAKRDLEDVPAMAILKDSSHWPYQFKGVTVDAVSYTHLRAHETLRYLVCRLLLEKTGS